MEKLNTGINEQETTAEISPQFLGLTSDNKKVYFRPGSHFHSEDGITVEVLESAISHIDTEDKDRVESQIDFEGPIGFDKCVEVGPDDNIIMVYRTNRNGQTPMVTGKNPVETNRLQIIIKQDKYDPGVYALATAFAGEKAPREPWDPSIKTDTERQESVDFWSTHALIYNEELIDWERTEKAS